MDDGMAIEFIHGGHDAVLEFLFGCDADMAQHRAGELGDEALDKIEPGAVLGREGEFEAADRLLGEPSLCLLGNVRGMIVENQLDRRMGRIGGIDELEEFNELLMQALDHKGTTAARALQFIILTAARSNEVYGAGGDRPR